jgi:hypothetical protein
MPETQSIPEPEEVEVSVVQEAPVVEEAPPVDETPAEEPEAPVVEEREFPSLEKELDKKRRAELEREALERELHEAAFAKRDLPSIEELARGAGESAGLSAEAQSGAVSEALQEMTGLIKEAQLGGWLEKLVYSIDSNRQAVSELVSELKASRKNQETMVDILKKIEKSLKQPGKSSKK